MEARTQSPFLRDARTLAPRTYTTEEAAGVLHIRAQTLRTALCRDGHYFSIRPQKAANRYLLWPAEAIDNLATGEVTK